MEPGTSLPTCYRHPDRETRLACTVCERPICTECMTTASVGQRCPDCAKPTGRSRVIRAHELARTGGTDAPFARTIIWTCVGLAALGVVPTVYETLYAYGAQANAAVAQGQWWRLLTSTLLHAPLLSFPLHLVFNMLALYLFGYPIEREVGSKSFAALYIASGLAGSATFYAVHVLAGDLTGSSVGASGAVFGLFGAWLAASIRQRHTLHGRAQLRSLLLLLAINAALPFLVPRIAWEAHLGGLIAGFLVAVGWGRASGATTTRGRVGIAAIVAGLALLAVVLTPAPFG